MYQLKIVVTALFAVLLLGQQLSRTRWLAIVILMLGAIGVQLPPSNKATANSDQDASLAGNQYIGAAAVLTACCTSGFAGVCVRTFPPPGASGVALHQPHLDSRAHCCMCGPVRLLFIVAIAIAIQLASPSCAACAAVDDRAGRGSTDTCAGTSRRS